MYPRCNAINVWEENTMKITPVQKRIEQQRIRHQQDKIHREHLEYVRKENQKRIEHPNKGKRIDEYV